MVPAAAAAEGLNRGAKPMGAFVPGGRGRALSLFSDLIGEFPL